MDTDTDTEKAPLVNSYEGNRVRVQLYNEQTQEDNSGRVTPKIITARRLRRRFLCRRSVRTYFSTGAILTAVVLERITYYSIVGNLVLFCTNTLKVSSTAAVTVNLLFTGLCYTTPVVGGRIADLFAGRFNTIYGSLLIALTGSVLLPVVAINYTQLFGHGANNTVYDMPMDFMRGFFWTGLILFAIGAGGMKANMSPLGAQQVEWIGEHAVHSFFNWFYWAVNIGGCIAFLAVIYVQQEIGFAAGYGISAATMLGAVILFLLPRAVYREHPQGSHAGRLVSILWYGTFGSKSYTSKITVSASSSPSSDSSYDEPIQWLDRAKVSCGGDFNDKEVDDVRSVMKAVPLLMTLVIFSVFTSQNTTSMLLQGERMNARITDGFVVPVAALNLAKMLVITLLLPLLDRVVYPLLDYFGHKPTLLQRIGFGQLVGVAALVLMGILEVVRKADMSVHGGFIQNVGLTDYNASYVSLFWQTPQFVLSGVAEAFTSVSALEFAYTEAPFMMQGMLMGINHLTTGIGSLLSSAIYNIVAQSTESNGDPWLPNDVNYGHLDWYSFLLAALCLFNFFVFLVLAKYYDYSCLGVADPTPETPITPFANSGEFRPFRRPSSASGQFHIEPELGSARTGVR